MHFVAAAVSRLAADACRRVLADAGIPQELLHAPQARVPAQHFAALWLAVARELDDEFFGLDRRRMKVGSFALLSRSVLHRDNLGHATKGILRGFGVFLDDVSADLSLQGAQAVITVRNHIIDPEASRFADETLLIMVYGLMCWLIGRRIPLQSTAFRLPKPAHAAEYAIMYGGQLSFDVPHTQIRFDAKFLSPPVIQNEQTLKEFLRTAPLSVFVKYRSEDSWTSRVQHLLRKSMQRGQWPMLEGVAHKCHVAPTTLRRKLEYEGTSYQEIKDELRRDLAIQHLCTTNLSIADIGRLLGFQESSAFHRAFKKWSGVQPGEYRARRLGGERPDAVRRT